MSALWVDLSPPQSSRSSCCPVLQVVHAVARAVVDPEFGHPSPNRSDITGISSRQSVDADLDTGRPGDPSEAVASG
jgi:hypothetical protein